MSKDTQKGIKQSKNWSRKTTKVKNIQKIVIQNEYSKWTNDA